MNCLSLSSSAWRLSASEAMVGCEEEELDTSHQLWKFTAAAARRQPKHDHDYSQNNFFGVEFWSRW